MKGMRFTFLLPLILCLAACHHGQQNNDAVRQGVIDHLTKSGINVAAMDVTLTSVQFNGNTADAAVVMTLKGAAAGPPMSFKYHLQQQNNKWVVTGRATGGAEHGSEAMPGGPATTPPGGGMAPAAAGADNPHGGGAARIPSPNDLPPATKKK